MLRAGREIPPCEGRMEVEACEEAARAEAERQAVAARVAADLDARGLAHAAAHIRVENGLPEARELLPLGAAAQVRPRAQIEAEIARAPSSEEADRGILERQARSARVAADLDARGLVHAAAHIREEMELRAEAAAARGSAGPRGPAGSAG